VQDFDFEQKTFLKTQDYQTLTNGSTTEKNTAPPLRLHETFEKHHLLPKFCACPVECEAYSSGVGPRQIRHFSKVSTCTNWIILHLPAWCEILDLRRSRLLQLQGKLFIIYQNETGNSTFSFKLHKTVFIPCMKV